jgi:hypothetical protein
VSVQTKTFINSAEDHAQTLDHTATRNSSGINVDVFGNFFAEEHVARKHLTRDSAQAIFVKVPVTFELFVILLASLYIRLDDDIVKPGLAVPGQSVTKMKEAKNRDDLLAHTVHRLPEDDAAAEPAVAAGFVHRDSVLDIIPTVPAPVFRTKKRFSGENNSTHDITATMAFCPPGSCSKPIKPIVFVVTSGLWG